MVKKVVLILVVGFVFAFVVLSAIFVLERRQYRQMIVRTNTATVSTSSVSRNDDVPLPVACPGPGINVDSHLKGTLTALAHGKTQEGDVIPEKVIQNSVSYTFAQSDDEGCHFTMNDTSTKGKVTHFYCVSTDASDTAQFFSDWESGIFLDNTMAFCNPADANKAPYPWECNYRSGIHCDVDARI